MTPTLRYATYALAAAVAAALYVGLESPSVEPGETAQGGGRAAVGQNLGLPELTSAGGDEAASVKRDLFDVVRPPPPEPAPVVAEAPPPPPPPPPPPDRLSDLNVIGVVARGPQLAILVELDDEVRTVVAGEPFGTDDALLIDGIADNRVQVTDRLANVTRTFTLTEEE